MGFFWYVVLAPLRLFKSLLFVGIFGFALLGAFLAGSQFAHAEVIVVNEDHSDVVSIWGYATNDNLLSAQSFTTVAGGDLEEVGAYVYRQASPVDDFVFALQQDSSGSPFGVDLAVSGTISGASVTATSCGAADRVYASFAGATLDPATKYWIVFRRTGAASATNYWVNCGDNTASHSESTKYTTTNSSTWTTAGDVAMYLVATTTSSGGGGATGGAIAGQWLLVVIPVAIVFLFFLHIGRPAEKFLAGLSPSPFLKRLFGVNWRARPNWYD